MNDVENRVKWAILTHKRRTYHYQKYQTVFYLKGRVAYYTKRLKSLRSENRRITIKDFKIKYTTEEYYKIYNKIKVEYNTFPDKQSLLQWLDFKLQ